jgi:hypothetical protein
VPFALPEVKRYLRSAGDRRELPAALNPTAATGLLIKSGVQHPCGACHGLLLEGNPTSQTEQYHDLLPMIAFLVNAPERESAAQWSVSAHPQTGHCRA